MRGTLRNYVELSRLKSSPMRLIVGPWTHSGNGRTYAGDVDFGPEAALADFDTAYQLRWFDRLLGADGAPPAEKPVRLFVMGTGDGTLTTTPPAEAVSSTTFTFDPAHPVPTLGGNVSARVKDGAYDQRERPDFVGSSPPNLPLSARSDEVVFQTAPLEEAITVVGPITVTLYASSDAVDTDFTVKLLDVYPPSTDFPSGFDLNLTDAIVRASYRNGQHTRDLITPGQVYELTIEPFPTANVFKKGHRIRVDVSSSNFPRWDVNPNTGEPLGRNRREVKADNTIWHDAARASRIVLPVMPAMTGGGASPPPAPGP